MAKVTKRCMDCNKEFISDRKNQVRCPECQKAHMKVMRQHWKKEKQAKHKAAPDPNECKRKDTCVYAGKMSGIPFCNYLSITGERRGCPVQGRTKYKRKPRKKKQEVDNEHILDKP